MKKRKLTFEQWLLKVHNLTMAQYLYDLNWAQQKALEIEYYG